MKIAISEATTMSASFDEDLDACAAAGCDALEIWLTKLEKHLEAHSADEARRRLADKGIAPVAASYQGGLLLSQGEARKAHYAHFRRRLELCQTIGIGALLVVADFTARIESTELERAVVSLAQAAQWASGVGVRLPLDFGASVSFCASLDTAVRLVDACGEPNVGVNLDAFHFFTGPSKEADLDLLSPENLAFVQICDLAGVPRELAADADRILP